MYLGNLGDNQLKISLQDLLNTKYQGQNDQYIQYFIVDVYGSQVDGGQLAQLGVVRIPIHMRQVSYPSHSVMLLQFVLLYFLVAAPSSSSSSNSSQQSHLMELARKQRMNTDVRKSVFCVIMSSEVSLTWNGDTIEFNNVLQDYIDAFEKLLKLGLKDTQQRELVHVTLHCCLQVSDYI